MTKAQVLTLQPDFKKKGVDNMASVGSVSHQKTIEQIIEEGASEKKNTRNTGELGKEDFLQLLITQVQHQDPLNPASDQEFIAQLAQFSALEQMQNLNRTVAYSTGFSMMGKYVSAEISDAATGKVKYIAGRVDMIRVVNGTVCAVVGNDEVPLENITQVLDDNISLTGNVTDYSSIIGMLGKSMVANSRGHTATIEGIIASVTEKDGQVYASLDEVEVKPYELDLGAFEDVEEYVEWMAGREVTIDFVDESSGEIFKITGILRSGYMGKDEELRFILDDIEVKADSIYSAKRIDLFNTEQMLLTEILKELRKLNNPGSDEEPSQ
jgi:flagellar basal-body rod modification protein FlgD